MSLISPIARENDILSKGCTISPGFIFLINPPFLSKNTYYYNYSRSRSPIPSLACLGGYLESRSIPYQIIDAKFEDIKLQQIIERIKRISPKLIGITSTTSEINDVNIMISKIKKQFPNSFIVLGGVHAIALPTETMEANSDIDVVVAGEGEFALEKMVLASDIQNALPDIPGVYYRKNGNIERNSPQEYSKDLFKYGKSAFHLWKKAEKYFVFTYRGCPFPCSFCFKTLGRGLRLRNPKDVLDELEFIASYAPESELAIVDATFGLPRSHTEQILKEIINKGLNRKLKWSCGTRVDVMDKPLLRLMKSAGCTTVSFGIESGSDRILKETGKNTSISRCIEAVREAKSVGLHTTGYYIYGHIGETKKEARETLNLICKMNCHQISVGVMVPWPGTKVFELAKKNQGGYRLLSTDFSKYDKYFGNVIEFENFSMKYLDILRIKSFVYLYLRNFRIIDLAKLLWSSREQAFKKLFQIIAR